MRRPWGGAGTAILAAIVCLLSASPIPAVAPPSLEYRVKAAFLLNFTKFVDWPPSAFPDPDSPLVVCILGDDPFGQEIDRMVDGEIVNGHRLAVSRIQKDTIGSCHVLFVANTDKEDAPNLGGIGPGILIVGEGERFVHEGGIITFVLENRRVRFDVNLKAALSAGLKLSSKLLSVARSVEK